MKQVKVDSWAGWVWVNMDPDCEPLADFLGELPSFFDRWPLEDRYTRVHISKVLKVNWKLAQDAFMESFHVITTHPQLLPGFADANSQYDIFGNVSRAISARGVPSPYLSWAPDEQQRLNSQIDQRMDDPLILEVPDGSTARKTLAQMPAGEGGGVRGVQFRGRRFDTGNPADYLRTIVQFACERPDIAAEFIPWLRKYLDDLA